MPSPSRSPEWLDHRGSVGYETEHDPQAEGRPVRLPGHSRIEAENHHAEHKYAIEQKCGRLIDLVGHEEANLPLIKPFRDQPQPDKIDAQKNKAEAM